MAEIPTEAYHDVTRVGDVAVSPDGDQAAFLTRESDPDDDERINSLWVVPTDGSGQPHRLTRASDASAPAWSPDGSQLGFIAAREEDPDLRVGREAEEESEQPDGQADGAEKEQEEEDQEAPTDNGGDEPKPQVWVFNMARGGDARQVTDREEGVTAFDWGPDGARVVVAARDPTDEEREYLDQVEDDGPVEVERLQHKFDGAGYLDEVTTYLFVVDVDSRTERRLDEANDGGYGNGRSSLNPAWGPDGRIAFTANHTDRPDDNSVTDVYIVDPDEGERDKLTEGDLAASNPTWSPAGNRLAFTGRDPENWYVPTEVFVAAPDEGEYTAISRDLDRTIGWGGSPEWIDGETLVGLLADEGRTRFVRFDASGAPENGGTAARAFQRQDTYETIGSLGVGGDELAFVVSTPQGVHDVHTMAVDQLDAGTDADDPRTRLTALNEEFAEAYQPPGCQRVTFESADGTEVESLAYYPPDFDPETPDPRPLILDIHGGPMSYDAPGFRFQDWYFTSRGYLVLKVNYRGSTSYGRAFCEELRGSWGTKDVADLQAGVDAMLDRGWADPDRLFPTGFSQGGVNTGYLVTRDDRWAAAAAEHGIYDFRACFGTDDSQTWWEADYGLPWENPQEYAEAESITDVGNVETPLLVTAGENDWRCPPSQAEQLYVSVRKQDVDAKLVVYQDEHHNVGDPERAVHRLEELRDWFAAYDPEREVEAGSGGGEN